jgi:hypothetical protein
VHHLALVEVPEDFINGTADTSLRVWLDERLEPYAFDSESAMVEETDTCCEDPACTDCAGTNEITSSYNPQGRYDWYCWGGRWGNLLYPRTAAHAGNRSDITDSNPWYFVVSGSRLSGILRQYLRDNELIEVFSENGFEEVDLSKETLTGAYYVLLDYHS